MVEGMGFTTIHASITLSATAPLKSLDPNFEELGEVPMAMSTLFGSAGLAVISFESRLLKILSHRPEPKHADDTIQSRIQQYL
jgi:hypothetical protein